MNYEVFLNILPPGPSVKRGERTFTILVQTENSVSPGRNELQVIGCVIGLKIIILNAKLTHIFPVELLMGFRWWVSCHANYLS